MLAPTRELAVQIARSFDTYGRGLGLRLCTVVGGLGYGRQIETLARGVDILIATPGRLLDLVERGNVKLGNVTFFVLDEADRMFDMGFIRDVRRIAGSVSKNRQTLLFSATMPNDIAKLAVGDPEEPGEGRDRAAGPHRREDRPARLLRERRQQAPAAQPSAVRRGARARHRLHPHQARRQPRRRGARGPRRALRGDPRQQVQNARQKALDNFSRGKARVLVATDLASRGIDVQGVTHVINYELPADAESYVHRIGRTARAGASGIAMSFCDGSERGQLKSIERLTNQRIAVVATPANEDMPAAAAAWRAPREERDGAATSARRERASARRRRPRWSRPSRSFGDRPRSFGGAPSAGDQSARRFRDAAGDAAGRSSARRSPSG